MLRGASLARLCRPEIGSQTPIEFSAIDLPARERIQRRRIFRALVESLHCIVGTGLAKRLKSNGRRLAREYRVLSRISAVVIGGDGS